MDQIPPKLEKKIRCCALGGIGSDPGMLVVFEKTCGKFGKLSPAQLTLKSIVTGKIHEIPLAVQSKMLYGSAFHENLESAFDAMFEKFKEIMENLLFNASHGEGKNNQFFKECIENAAQLLDTFQANYLTV